MINFLRIIKESKKPTLPQNIKNFSFVKGANIPADLLSGFETKNNTLSLFAHNNDEDIERILANFETLRTQCTQSINDIHYVQFNSDYLDELNLEYKLNPMEKYLDKIVQTNHYDIVNIDTNILTHIISNFNKDIISKKLNISTVKKSDILIYIKKHYESGNLNLNGNYKKNRIEEFFNKD